MAEMFSIKIVGDPKKFQDILAVCYDVAAKEMQELGDNVAAVSRATLEQLTPRDTHYTATAWFTEKSTSGSFRGKPLIYNTIVDHPFNTPGAVHPVPDANGRLRPVNTPKFNLLEALEYGTAPHTIAPKDKKYLHFFTRAGKEVFATQVQHPGTKPYGMMRQAMALAQRLLNDFGPRAVERIVAAMNAKSGGSK
jgi:hypothetical protein